MQVPKQVIQAVQAIPFKVGSGKQSHFYLNYWKSEIVPGNIQAVQT